MIKEKIIEPLFSQQDQVRQLIIVSILIALGVNLMATGVISLLKISSQPIMLIVLGMLFSLGVIFIVILYDYRKLNKTINYEGFFIYNQKTHNIYNIKEYEIVENMSYYLKAALSENKALKNIWIKNGLRVDYIDENGNYILKTSKSCDILNELIEYCILNRLCTHLDSYFKLNKLNDIKVIDRYEIPDILLENRFLKIFSEDINNREYFIDCIPDKNEDEEFVSINGKEGTLYEKFELLLPRNSKIKRKNKNTILIDNYIFTISLSCMYDGYSSLVRRCFFRKYIHSNDSFNDVEPYRFDVGVSIKFKPISIFCLRKKEYYLWADSFLEELSEYISKDAFFAKINWNTVSTLMRCMEGSQMDTRYI